MMFDLQIIYYPINLYLKMLLVDIKILNAMYYTPEKKLNIEKIK